ncbi:hypothetical protein P152DRAFT_189606 [Eremomyces bilateralis CBS 781.70]|uniref:Uncharacterized protein n=1 Tax=Eremomyces bilateralis CBS 781.70 TaxID=1392243 RepID=A0A6G1GBW2_9PEZI|nr:uncharacterized protein P152DRAFT_189606 [Eremomyces bilateralis CBS 781.70]KAF1815577.1 hypothetical protein P152DRAFT_189606 [Eremomyces bilateralis CBS 781.70]
MASVLDLRFSNIDPPKMRLGNYMSRLPACIPSLPGLPETRSSNLILTEDIPFGTEKGLIDRNRSTQKIWPRRLVLVDPEHELSSYFTLALGTMMADASCFQYIWRRGIVIFLPIEPAFFSC